MAFISHVTETDKLENWKEIHKHNTHTQVMPRSFLQGRRAALIHRQKQTCSEDSFERHSQRSRNFCVFSSSGAWSGSLHSASDSRYIGKCYEEELRNVRDTFLMHCCVTISHGTAEIV
jgi:hypothetical protein